MRITDLEALTIKNTVIEHDSSAQVYLFGSRTKDDKRGGDIDILIISPTLNLMDSVRIQMAIEEKLGELDMDIVIKPDRKDIFVKMVMEEGAILL